jgi:hypothetical protein
MADGHHQHHQVFVAEFADDAVVADAIPPQSVTASPKWLPKITRTLCPSDPVIQVVDDLSLNSSIELLEVLESARIVFNGPGQAASVLPGW